MISSTLQSLSYSQPLDLVAEVRRRLVSSSVPTMDHIPSGARAVCSSKITSILNAVTRDVFQLSGWLDLLTFAPVVLAKPRRVLAGPRRLSSLSYYYYYYCCYYYYYYYDHHHHHHHYHYYNIVIVTVETSSCTF